MDNKYFIDNETFEIYEAAPNGFTCDKRIANALANLNKLGYFTKSSCEGDSGIKFCENIASLEYLEEAKNEPSIIIRKINEDNFVYWSEITGTSTYIMFQEKYDFPSIPLGFTLEEDGTIRRRIYLYKDNVRKTQKEINEEIDENCNILNEWARNLSKEKKGKMKNE